MKSFNERAVNGLYHSSKPARIILNAIAGMPRQNETLLDALENRLVDEKDITRRDIVTFFKHLEEYGAGEFIPGRRGHPSRFKWSVDSINVSTVDVSFPVDEQAEVHRPEAYAALPIPRRHEAESHSVMINHSFTLRPNLLVNLTLPTDITPTEAQRLSQFIQSLPFVPERRGSGADRSASTN